MPCFGTTDKTRENSLRLMKELGVTSRTVDISASVRAAFCGHRARTSRYTTPHTKTRRRAMRTLVLMDIANDNGGFVVGTGDLSELALGWATYNGDHMSMLRRECLRS